MAKKNAQTTPNTAPKKRAAPTRRGTDIRTLCKIKRRVCCISYCGEGENYNVLSYGQRGDRRFNGKIRTYFEDQVDDRIAALKRVKSVAGLERHLWGNKGNVPVIAFVDDVIEMGMDPSEFAPVID